MTRCTLIYQKYDRAVVSLVIASGCMAESREKIFELPKREPESEIRNNHKTCQTCAGPPGTNFVTWRGPPAEGSSTAPTPTICSSGWSICPRICNV
jgi:hypothetical protein